MQRTQRLSRPIATALRRSSSMAAAKPEWLVILPDLPDALERRMQVRPDHLKNVQPAVQSGQVTLGGAILHKPCREGETPAFAGSAFRLTGDSQEEVVEFLKKDVYTQNSVWDWSKVQIFPFKSAPLHK